MASVDLGRKYSNDEIKPPSPKEKSYPSVTIYGVEGLDLETGPFNGTVTGNVSSYTENDDGTCNYTIELHGMDAKNGKEGKAKSLEEDLNDIEKSKQEEADEGDAADMEEGE